MDMRGRVFSCMKRSSCIRTCRGQRKLVTAHGICQLTRLKLDSTGLTDKGLSAIAALPQLQSLNVMNLATSQSAMVTPPSQVWGSDRTARLNWAPTGTSFSVGTKMQSNENQWLRSMSAEQKVFEHFNVTGGVSETTTGTLNKSLTAGFKQSW